MNSKKNPNLIETDREKEFYNSIFQIFLNNNNFKHYSRNSSLGAVFAERFNRTSRDLLKRPVFEKGNSIWIDTLPTVTKQCNNRVRTATKLTPIQAYSKKNQAFVYLHLLD